MQVKLVLSWKDMLFYVLEKQSATKRPIRKTIVILVTYLFIANDLHAVNYLFHFFFLFHHKLTNENIFISDKKEKNGASNFYIKAIEEFEWMSE